MFVSFRNHPSSEWKQLNKNGTLGFVHKNGPKPATPFWQIAQYLSERGFAVLRYDKRGIGANFTY